jgi:hypothetical protein
MEPMKSEDINELYQMEDNNIVKLKKLTSILE